MSDATITATTSIDTSGFVAGLAVLKEQYSQATDEVRQSVQRVADAEKQATNAIAAGHTQLGAALKNAANIERESLNGLIAKQLELKTAVDAANGALGHQVSATIAAGAEMRVLEGAMPIRAAEQFIARIEGVAPVLQAAFPVFGAIALGEVLVRADEAAYKLSERFDDIAKARKRATEEMKEFDRELARTREEIVRLNDKQFEDTYGKVAASAKRAADQTQNLAHATTEAMLREQLATQRNIADNPISSSDATGGAQMAAQYRQRAVALIEISRIERELDLITAQRHADELKQGEESLQSLREQQSERDKALKHEESEADRAAKEEQRYQQEISLERSEQFVRGLHELQEYGAKKTAELERQRLQDLDAAIKDSVEQAKAAEGAQKRETESLKRGIEERRRIRIEDAEAGSAGRLADLAGQRASLQKPEGVNKTPEAELAYLEALRSIDHQIIAEKQRTQLQIIADDAAAAAAAAQISEEAASEAERRTLADIRKLQEINRQGQIAMANDTKAILNQQMQQYQQFFQQINAGFQRSFDQWLSGHKSFVASVQQVWAGMVVSFTNSIIQMGLKWAEQQILMTVANATGVAARTAAVAAGSAAQASFASVAAAAQIQVYAAEASAATYAALSPIPIVGPALAAVAAPAVYYTVEALGTGLAAFETGGIIPNTGVALVHQGEAVLPAPLTQTLMNASGEGGGITINGGVHVHSPSANPKQHAIDFMSQLRSMNLKLA